MKNIVVVFILLTSCILFAQKTDRISLEQMEKTFDSIQYSASDFIKMQKYFTENSELLKVVSKKATKGDEGTTNLLEILTLTYEKANKKYGEKEIKTVIHGYYMSMNTLKKFNKLNADFKAEIDSLNRQKKTSPKEDKEVQKLIDSLKKHQ